MTAVTAPTATSTTTDRADAIAALVVAFSADPVIRWMYPNAQRYLVHFPELVQLLSSGAFEAGAVDRASRGAGTALWVPPGAPTDDEALVELLVRSIDAHRHPTAFSFLEQVQQHHPTQPHWYLPVIGVDPRCQGQGYGSSLLRRGLDRCDRDGLPAYLEASSPRNRELYERHGFEVIAVIQADDSPPLWPMLRPPR